MATSNDTPDSLLPPDLADRVGVLAPVQLAALALGAKLEAAKIRTLKLKHARLVASEGASSPQVAALEQTFDARVAALAMLRSNATAAMHATTARAKRALVIHGHVLDRAGKPVIAATVVALDPQQKTVATAQSDASGAYTLQIASDAAPAVTLRVTAPHGKPITVSRTIDVVAGKAEAVELRTE
jgi:hypothetical protein